MHRFHPLLFALLLVVWLTLFDADFITFGYDIHRRMIGNNNISNKSVWIVGASSGIGEYLVYELIECGCTKFILSSRRHQHLQRVKTEALELAKVSNKSDIQIIIKPLDLIDFAIIDDFNNDFVYSLMKEISNVFGTIDILVMNSGHQIQFGYAVDNHINILQKQIQTNALGPIALIQSMIRYWHKSDPNHNNKYQIAVTLSVEVKLGSPKQSAAAMSKSTVNGYLETLRMEVMNDNIDINIIHPGFIEKSKYSIDTQSNSLNDQMMSLKRCAQLYVTSLEYSITESIISRHPILAFIYIKQYLPSMYFNPITRIVLPIFDKTYTKPKSQ